VIDLTMWVLMDGKKVNRQSDGELRLFQSKEKAVAFLDNFWVPRPHNWKPQQVKVTDAK
jgi:hypothetical protein